MLVSNLGQFGQTTGFDGLSSDYALQFTTGDNAGGYDLESVDVRLGAYENATVTVTLHSVSSGNPASTSLFTFTNPTSGITANAVNTFTAPSNTTLTGPNTSYFIVVTGAVSTGTTHSLQLGWTSSDDEDNEGADDWAINDDGHGRLGTDNWTTSGFKLQIRVNGSAKSGGGTPTCTLNTGDLWCGVVTVGAITTGGSVAAHGFAGADGGLDDKTFSVGTNNYTIDGLYVGTAGDLNLDLTGALDAADKGNLKLVVGSTDFDLDDATHVSSENAYLWTGTGLDWSSDTYVTLRLRRAVALSTDATLSGLTVYDGSSNLTLSPSFASAGTEPYTASAAYDIATVTVTATKNQADATVAWLDASDATLADADAMASGHQVALAAGGNTFKVKVTAEDGTTTKTYTVTVNRASPSCTLNTGDLWCGVVTVGNGAGFDGYAASVSLGALSDRTFSVGTNNYTIDAIYVEIGGFNPERLTFNLASGLTSADQAALVLHLGSVEFEFSDANVAAGLSYKWSDTGLNWSSESFVTLRLRDTPVANNAPVFSPTSTTREVEENSAAGTNVGAVIPEATDADSGDTLTYSMEGTDAASFAFDASTRQITTITGVTYNHEATKNSYSVTVKASDGTASATIAVTIDVTDVNEKSAKPDKPTLAAVTGSSTTLTATWTKPDLNDGPDITGYAVQYREGTTGTWTAFAHTGAALTTTITGLTADTSYQVRVRAKNGETDSDWSDASTAVSTNAAGTTPTITAVAITSTPVLETDTYGQGERIEVTVTFSEAVNATSDTDFVLSVGGTDTRAPVLDGSGTTTLVFSYTVRASDEDDNGIWIGDQDRTLVGDRMGLPQAGAITSVATSTAADLTHSGLGTDADHKVDGSRSIVLVAVSSTPMLETDTYGAGETIRFTVTFSSGVSIGGSPVFRFSLGNLGLGRQVDAAYESGAGSAALVFGYTVVSSDEDDDGIWIGHQGQTLVGTHQTGTITIVATSEAAAGIEHDALGVLSGHKVDGSRTTGNNAPAFLSDSTGLSLPENSAAGTVIADSASVLTATDADTGDTLTYSMDGTDAASFDFDTSTREMKAKSGVTYNHEEKSTYSVTVNVDDGRGGTDTVEVTIDVTDVNEKSAKPDQPTLAKVTGSSTSLTATWTKPDLDGGPEITGYAVQYKVNTATTWEDFAHSETAVTTTVTGLTADTSYQVRVRAENGETDSDWSDASDAVSTNAEMSTPTCTLNTGDLWCGVVTVGAITATQDGFFQMTGGLSDTTFSVGTHSYTIDAVSVDDSTVSSAGHLVFSLTSALTAAERDKLVLHVGSNTFAFSAAGYGASTHNYSWIGTSLDWLSTSTVTLRLRAPNNAPVFADASVTREVAENSAVGTDVGAVVTATDADSGDTLEYSLEGTDAASFDIDDSSGQIQTVSGVDYNHEAAQNSYSVTVKASDGLASDTIVVTIDVTDVNEKSAKPDKPTLAKITGSSTSLTATWTKPGLNGGPEITGYDVEYKVSTDSSWTAFAHTGSGLTTTITGLTADTSYQVRVRAKNGETDSDWSDASDAVKTNAEMTTTCALNPGDLWCGVVTVEELVFEGTSFAYGFVDASASPNPSDTGALSDKEFTVGTNRYTIDIATVGLGATAEGLNFSLTSALSDTDKEKLVLHVGSRTFAFSDATRTNDGFTYQWSNTGLDWSSETSVTLRLRGAPNNAPAFSPTSTTRTVEENSTAGTNVGAVIPEAMDADSGDTLTYSMEGTDAASFAFDASARQITTIAGVDYNFEATQNTYEVTVKASDGTDSGELAVTISLTDAAEKSAKPDKPTLAAVTGSSTSLTATWTKPDLNGGPDITGYAVQYREGTTGTWEDFAHSDTAVTTTVTGLTADTSYQVQVRAKNGETDSDWSDPSDAVRTNAVDIPIPPGLEVTLHLSDEDGSVLENAGWITVTAAASPASPVPFTVTVSADPVAPATEDDFRLSSNRVLSFAANATESTGTVRIQPVDDDDPEPPDVVTVSGAVSNAAIPDPDNVTLTIINDDPDFPQDIAIDAPAAVDEDAGTAAVTVTLTTRRNTAPVIGVNLFYRPRPETATRGNDYTLPFNHLTRFAIVPVSAFSPNAAGTAYVAQHAFTLGIVDDQEAEVAETIVFQIYSQNNNTGSPEQTITIRDDDAAVPGRPAGLTALPKGQTRIQLAWTAPADEGSFPITHYRIEASEDAGSSWNVVARTRDARTDFRHGGLSAGDTRHYRVSAISAAGASGPSDVASATTVSAGPAATNPDLPPPADVTAVPKLPRQILLSWWRDPNAESKDLIDRFHYRYRVRDANTWSDWATAGQTLIPNTTEVRNYNERIVTGLTAGTTYEFQVRSVDKDDTYSAAAAALATAVGPRTISIARPSGPVTEGEPLRFTLSREQPHGRLDVVVRISETGDMLQRSRPNSHYVHKTVRFAGGQTTAALVVETVDDGDAAEPNSRVTAEVKQVNAHPYGYLYEVHGSRGSATKTVTARTESTRSAALSVADAEATEGEDATLDFVVRLDGNPGSDVTVDYRTVDGTATAGSDYTETSGTLTFAPGEDAKTVPVPIADDDVEDNGETFTLVLSNASGATIADAEATGTIRNSETTTPQADLTASFEGVPEAHDGESGFRFRVAFSEDIGISYRSLREDAFTVTGGRVTGGKRVDGRRDLFEMTVEPDAGGDVTITLPAGRECGVSGAICTKGENRRQLTNSPSATVAGPPEDVREPNTAAAGAPTIGGTPRVGEELTASTSGISDADGLDNASFAYQWIRTDTDIGGAAGSTYTAVDADEGKTLKVRVSFTDGAGNEESLTSAATDAIAARPNDAPEPDTLTTGSTTEPVKVSVADARVSEAPGATLDFAVTLSGPAPGPVTVDYRTADANAKAGEDYTARQGALTFRPGETSKTVRVTVLDDAHDEGDEKMVLVLYRASGAIRDDYLAVGTIKNTDPMPKAWLARFGRAASDHAVAAIEGRWRGGAEARPQTHLTIGGRRVENLFDFGRVRDGFNAPAAGPAAADPRLDPESAWGRMDRLKAEAPGPAGGSPAGGGIAGSGPAGGNPGLLGGSLAGGPLAGSPPSAPRSGAARSMLLNTLGLPDPQGLGDLRQLLMGSSFFYSRPLDEHGEAGGGRGWLGNWSAWGETAVTRFSGADGPLALNGEVATATLGADSRWGRWHGGVALAYSEGDGVYTHPQATGGAVRSTLTSLHPFARYEVSERTSVWGVLGYGVGGLTLTPDSAGSGSEPGVGSGSPGIETGLKTAMAAFGGRGVLSVRSSRFGAFEFAVVSDALVTNTVSDTVENLMGTAGQTSRVRVLLEGSGSIPLGNGGRLMPTLEAGLRYDDGDAETGSGLEVGAGLGYAAGALAVEVTGRMLLAHQDSDYEEWGFSGSIRYQPRPGGRGLSMNLGSSWGAAQSGVQSLWSRQDASGLVRGAAMHAAQRFQAELGYGFAGRRADSMWMPFLGVETAGGGAQSLRLGVRLASGPNVEMGLEFGRRDNGRDSGLANGLAGPEHAVQLRGSIRW